MSDLITRLAKMQVGCPSLIENDWAAPGRESGDPIPSAHICIGWVQPDIERLEAEVKRLTEERDAARELLREHCPLRCGHDDGIHEPREGE